MKRTLSVEIVELRNATKLVGPELSEQLPTIESVDLLGVCTVFVESHLTIRSLLGMPLTLMSYGVGMTDAVREVVKHARARTTVTIGDLKEVITKTAERMRDRQDHQRIIDRSYRTLQAMLNKERPEVHPDLRNSLRSLILACISAAWTAFEAAAGDCWEVLVNSCPSRLVPSTLEELEASESDALSQKQIPVGLLAKHGFDMRSKMGTVLRKKFDFTSVSGIRKAYKPILGDGSKLDSALRNKDLARLEAIRHLIVHHGGIIDEEFKRRTDSRGQVGVPFPLEGDPVKRFVTASANTGCILFLECNAWLSKASKHA